jgi:hypothetical protein
MWTRLRPLLLLALLDLAFFLPLLLHPGEVLYAPHSDFPDLHIPAKRFLVRTVHETGELPLWDPYQLAGAPYVHDIQAGIFYPPHALLYLLPEDRVGAGLSWLVALHLLLAGWFSYAYAREQGLSEPGALVAGAGWMFAGRWLLHLLAGGHYVLIGLAWLPLLLLCMERAIRRGSFGWATAAGVVVALVILGTHPQWTFYAGLFVLLWTPATALEVAGWWGGREGVALAPSMRRALARWLLVGGWAAVVGVALAAVQLLPTAEAAGEAMRAGGVGESGALMGGVRSVLFLVGPTLVAQPHNLAWEDRGGLALLWLVAAITAALAGRSRVRYLAMVTLALAVFAAGGSTVVEGLPGFRLFRQPPRMFIIVGFPVALLAGHATDMVFGGGPLAARALALARRVLPRVAAAVAILAGGFAVRSWWTQTAPLQGHLYWFSLALTVPAAFILLARQRRRAAVWAWCGLLLVDLWALAGPLVDTRPEGKLFRRPACLAPLVGRPAGDGRVLDRGRGDVFVLADGAGLARVWGLEALRGYNPLDYRRFKEYLRFAGGSSAPLRPQDGALTFPVLGHFGVAHKSLLDLLNVRYLLQPADDDRPRGWGEPVAVFPPEAGVFNFLAGGVPDLPAYALYENPTALPRAFVVFRAAPLPSSDDEVLERLRQTDFRREVLLEGDLSQPSATEPVTARTASVSHYGPNNVEVLVGDGPAGWLVLADPWYPGWRCSIDGRAAALVRADFLFRAVAVPEGAHVVTFAFEPSSYFVGRRVSLAAVAAVTLLFVALAVRRLGWARRSR